MHFRKHAYVITVDILFLTVIIILMVDGWGLAWVRPPMVQYQIYLCLSTSLLVVFYIMENTCLDLINMCHYSTHCEVY